MSESNVSDNLKIFSTGAVRTKDADKERYDLITPIGLEGVARIYAEGAEKYGDKLWEHGMPISDLVNHALRHWRLYASGDRSEDHLSKAAWGFLGAKHSEVLWPHLNVDLRRAGCIPPVVDDETAASWRRFREGVEGLSKSEKTRKTEKVKKTRYLFAVPLAPGEDVTGYFDDLQERGHEAVARRSDYASDLDGCDAVIVFGQGDSDTRVSRYRGCDEPFILIGECPDDFPRYGTEERCFPTWAAFLNSLDVCEEARKSS